jgi:paraquat-inducible protein B
MDYERDMMIDESSLDVEWLEQAPLATRWGMYYNECKDEFARAEENVKVVRSELVLEINKDPEKFLGKDVKLTDTKVEAAYRTHQKHLDAKERWLQAMKKMNDAEIVKNEISFTRKAALENLVDLHGQQYFAGPKMPRNLREERDKVKERYNRKVRMRKR